MCIGETGIGKSTLMDTLFNTNFNLSPSTHHEKEVKLNSNTFELTENNMKLKLTIIESSGFGDQINKENSNQQILDYINEQYEAYVQEELNLKRSFKPLNDTRIHLCLYFICPTGHSLKMLDLETMKALDCKCNIVPIIAKADTISKNELNDFKKRIMLELNNNHVNIYQFPINDFDLNISNLNATTNAMLPLAVIGSSDLVKIGNKFVRGRNYEWGTVSVENESHCDFLKLREMILSTNLIDLIETTHSKHYQMYRASRLKEIGFKNDDEDDSSFNEKFSFNSSNSSGSTKTIQDVYNLKKNELIEEMQKKECDIKEEFIRKVKDKECEIRETEREVC
jgi:septin 6/8/11